MENLTNANILDILNSIGIPYDDDAYIRYLKGSKEDAIAFFNILAKDQNVDPSPTNPDIKYFYPIEGDESHKIQLMIGNSNRDANATIDLMGYKPYGNHMAKIKFKNNLD